MSVAKTVLGRLVAVFDHPGDAMEGSNSDKDNAENYDGVRSWVTEVEMTERMVGEILNKVEKRAEKIGMREQKHPRGILRELNSDTNNGENSDLAQDYLDIENFELIKTVGKGK